MGEVTSHPPPSTPSGVRRLVVFLSFPGLVRVVGRSVFVVVLGVLDPTVSSGRLPSCPGESVGASVCSDFLGVGGVVTIGGPWMTLRSHSPTLSGDLPGATVKSYRQVNLRKMAGR